VLLLLAPFTQCKDVGIEACEREYLLAIRCFHVGVTTPTSDWPGLGAANRGLVEFLLTSLLQILLQVAQPFTEQLYEFQALRPRGIKHLLEGLSN
jgi:hypothetical protein